MMAIIRRRARITKKPTPTPIAILVTASKFDELLGELEEESASEAGGRVAEFVPVELGAEESAVFLGDSARGELEEESSGAALDVFLVVNAVVDGVSLIIPSSSGASVGFDGESVGFASLLVGVGSSSGASTFPFSNVVSTGFFVVATSGGRG